LHISYRKEIHTYIYYHEHSILPQKIDMIYMHSRA
jgi:hypothetical protein